jgi:hypothetical protein
LGRKAISGKVTLGGAPLERGSISFEPQQKDGVSSGAVITDGRYEIEAVKGLPVGDYLVRIHASRGGAEALDEPPGPTAKRSAPELIPAEYNTKSDKIISVTEDGPTEFNFDVPKR